MVREVDEVMARWDSESRRLLDSPEAARARQARRKRTTTRLAKQIAGVGIVGVMLLVAMLVWGLVIGPLGINGLFVAGLIGAVAVAVSMLATRERTVAPAAIVAAAPGDLAAKADLWLDRQRKSLPAAAAPVLDAISTRLTQLQPRLALADQRDPLAADLSRLLGQHLPGLVDSYAKIPAGERAAPMDARLVEGLKLVEAELGDKAETLAAVDRDAFLTQGRFIETKYGRE